ncbi:Mut7-C RNAse domain-containing protein [Bailinhaonella thermotolerans]|uniref:Mut7-C RNAse domain-containing protein n=1 Tax=Bailinhaonella thermotolerans TaxID=1070861 RepID=A0A3A4AVF2_9ACTN|nr:Mut7-C RNAse domain-containing protein [Bailinhaonella thermotolerans]RJL32691.1 hypothetical protein D5H75_14455 [Bailinhaonella thermotolerans]
MLLRFSGGLADLVSPRRRGPVAYDGTSSLGHVVESAGVPLTEVGELREDGEPVPPARRPRPGAVIDVLPVRRPQPAPARYLLDVHLGTLARRMRLLGLDTAYGNDLDDDELACRANAEDRVLLTKDRGLLRRRALRHAAYVRGDRPDDQLRDVLDRFAPGLAPWTRCTACNTPLAPVGKAEVADELPPGTRRTYDTFARCPACRRVYWPGAHHARLQAVVAAAESAVSASRAR